jgi:ribosomal protein S18 acetylase RimI-like enzyme
MIIRAAEGEDALAVAHVHVQSWRRAYAGLLPEGYLADLRAEERAAKYDFSNPDPSKPQTMVAAEGMKILGFATVSKSHDEDLPNDGELCALHVDPEFWGQGVGLALMKAARKRMFDNGFRTALLWLLVGNARAARFYEADGWRQEGPKRSREVWKVLVDEIRYRRDIAGD